MLAGQQSCRHDDGDLLAPDGRNEGGAQRDFRFAEADIATNKPIHRTSRAEVLESRVDGRQLIVGLLVRETGAKFVIGSRADCQAGRVAQLPFGGDLDQFARNLTDAALHPRLARLPVAAAEPIKIDRRFLRPITRQQIDVFDGQEQFVAAGIVDFEAIVRRACRLDGLQPSKTTDAVVDMHDQIARCEACRFGDEILRPCEPHGAGERAGRQGYPAR